MKTDVTKYEDTLALFKLALKEYGRVDHAFSVAGIMEKGQVFEPDLTVESAETVCILLDVSYVSSQSTTNLLVSRCLSWLDECVINESQHLSSFKEV